MYMSKRFIGFKRPEQTQKEPGSQFREQLAHIQQKIDRAYHRQTPEETLGELKALWNRQRSRILRALLEKRPSSEGNSPITK